MDIIESNLVNAIREIVRQELNDSTIEGFDARVEAIICQKGLSLISNDVDEAIGDYIRNNVNIEINC